MTEHTFGKRIGKLQQAVFAHRPVFAKLMREHGKESLRSYIRASRNSAKVIAKQERANELIREIAREVARLFDVSLGDSVAAQLRKHYVVSTADHHGILTDPVFTNANIITAAALRDSIHSPAHLVVIANANISLNNPSFPRGCIVRSDISAQSTHVRFSFMSATDRMRSIVRFPAYNHEALHRVLTQIDREAAHFSDHTRATLTHIMHEVHANPRLFSFPLFSDQATIINDRLWEMMTMGDRALPQHLLYLEQERLIAALLTRYHMQQDTIAHRMLFHAEYRKTFLNYFNNTPGAFSVEKQEGTFLFWFLPRGEKYRVSLWPSDAGLMSADGAHCISWTSEAFTDKLASQELIPSTLMSYLLLAFYYGMTCLGGVSQVNYLPAMQERYGAWCDRMGEDEEKSLARGGMTTLLASGFLAAFIGRSSHDLTPMSAYDWALYAGEEHWKKIEEVVKRVTLAEAVVYSLPYSYRAIIPEPERDPELASVLPGDIVCMTKTENNIVHVGFNTQS